LAGIATLLAHKGTLHSQLGQECFVLSQSAGISNPRYLEIGAYDPVHWSNTASLRESFGWTGFHVDPNPVTARAFDSLGLAHSFIEAAVVGKHQPEVFLHVEGAMSSTSNFSKEKNDLKVATIQPVDLLKVTKSIDYLSLDIEGGEYDVLVSWPWEVCKPKIITVEHNFMDNQRDKIASLLIPLGYREFLPSLTDFESWFVRD